MKFDIDITDAKVATFSNQAKDELKTQIDDISIKLVDEALRIETSERLKGDKQEVTSSIVQKASELFQIRYNHDNNRTKRICVEICSLVSMSLASIAFTIAFHDLSNNSSTLFIAIIFLMVGIATSVISIMGKYE